jgi:RimJ/RimL family protein N-acetyltransferase
MYVFERKMMRIATSVMILVPALSVTVALSQSVESGPWAKEFTPPTTLDTERVHLEPLGPKHAEMDYEAIMSSREHLQKTLHWGDWPAANMTVEDNRSDLERHGKEFENREAYAYTVLTPDRKRCLGCVYMKPLGKRPRAMMLAYWVVADELDSGLDKHLIESVLSWIESDWPLNMVVLPLHTDNTRGVEIAERLKLRKAGPPRGDIVRFMWFRPEK